MRESSLMIELYHKMHLITALISLINLLLIWTVTSQDVTLLITSPLLLTSSICAPPQPETQPASTQRRPYMIKYIQYNCLQYMQYMFVLKPLTQRGVRQQDHTYNTAVRPLTISALPHSPASTSDVTTQPLPHLGGRFCQETQSPISTNTDGFVH